MRINQGTPKTDGVHHHILPERRGINLIILENRADPLSVIGQP